VTNQQCHRLSQYVPLATVNEAHDKFRENVLIAESVHVHYYLGHHLNIYHHSKQPNVIHEKNNWHFDVMIFNVEQ